MAASNENSAQYAKQIVPNEGLPSPDHGRVKALTFELTQVAAGDAGSVQSLIKLPAGKIRVLSHLSSLRTSAFGSSRTLDVGYAAYRNLSGTPVNADPDAFATAVDVSAGATAVFTESTTMDLSQYFESQDGILLTSTVAGGTIPVSATIKGVVLYVYA